MTDTMPTSPLTADTIIMLHRCSQCERTWNGTLAQWRTDRTRNICNTCMIEMIEEDEAVARYLDGEFDEENNDAD